MAENRNDLTFNNTTFSATPVVNCPHCGKLVCWQESERFRPFCSERCKLIDLGAWADESHRIPGHSLPDEVED